MIKGLGTDIVEVERIKLSLSKGNEFKNLVFHPDEIAYCDQRGKSNESYAGRFAAKEAFVKALGTGWRDNVSFNELLFLNDELGKPYLRLTGKSKVSLAEFNDCSILVSISHTSQFATAVVIIEERKNV